MLALGRASGQPLLATIVLILIHYVTTAPVEDGTTQALQQYTDAVGDGRGCYYNFERYDEGDRIVTNEPCLNCTCHNRMLMCYLRVCPFTKAIGQDCTVEKKPDQCCPIITCPQVPVALLTSSTTESPTTTTALGKIDNYGCILEDNTFYADGAQVPSDPRKPCELCYCIRNHTACVMQECTLNVEGCKPVYQEGVCCPVRYDCEYDEVLTTPKPVGLVTTPGGSSDCLHNGQTYHDGEMVMKDEKAPCEHCYCMRGDIVCAVQECGTPLEGRDCTPLERTPGQCCPNYHCANGTQETESVYTSTEKLPESVKEESAETEKHDASESSNESDSSSEESQEVPESSPTVGSEESADKTESHSPQEQEPQVATEQAPASEGTAVTEPSQAPTEAPQQPESSSAESTKVEENMPTTADQQPEDSHSEASHHEVAETHVPHEAVKDPQVTNEIPALPATQEHSEATTTTEEPVESVRIPGEGSCLVEGKTYAHNTIVPTENPCQEVCRCFSSIVSCKPRDCPPAPSADENCMPVSTPGSCCPTYMCDQKTSDAPEVQDHKLEHGQEGESTQIPEVRPSTHIPSFEEPPATEAPVVVGIPPETLIPGAQDHGLTMGTHDEEANVAHHEESNVAHNDDEEHKEEDVPSEPQPEEAQKPAEDNSQINANIVNANDASLHGGQGESLESAVNSNVVHPAGDVSTEAPADSTVKAEVVQESIVTQKPEESVNPTEQAVTEGQDTSKTETESPAVHHDSAVTVEEQPAPSEAEGQSSSVGPVEPEEAQPEVTTAIYQEQDAVEEHSHQHSAENVPEQEPMATEVIPTDAPVDESVSSVEPEQPAVEPEQPAEVPEQPAEVPEQPAEVPEQPAEVPEEKPQPEGGSQDEKLESGQTNEDQSSATSVPETAETTVIPSVSEDVPHHEENPEEANKEEHIPTEAPMEETPTGKPDFSSDANEPQQAGEAAVTAVPSEGNEAAENVQSSENPAEEMSKPSDDETKQTENLTDAPQVQQEVESSPVTTEPPAQAEIHIVTTEQPSQPGSDSAHHDSVPESSQQNVETAETIVPQNGESGGDEVAPVKEEDSLPQTTASQDISAGVESTAAPVSSELESAGGPEPEHKPEQTEPEQTAEIVATNEEEKQPIPEDEQKQDGTPSPAVVDEVTPSAVNPEAPSGEVSSQSPQDELPIIIHQEVGSTSMPPIESHVTEGSLDHSVSHEEVSHVAEVTAQPHEESQETYTPGPEGISQETSSQEPQEAHQESVTAQTEDNKAAEAEAEKKPESEPPTSPEIINEINSEKESMNKITADNTAQLIDDIHQIIQNEIINNLHPAGETVHAPTNEEDTDLKPVENESVVEPGTNNQETIPETTAAPAAEETHSEESVASPSEEEHKEPSQDIAATTETPAAEGTVSEKEPAPAAEEHAEAEAGSDDTAAVPTTSAPESVPTHEEAPLEQLPEGEEKPHSEETGDVGSESATHSSQVVEEHPSEVPQETESSHVVPASDENPPETHTEAAVPEKEPVEQTNEVSTEGIKTQEQDQTSDAQGTPQVSEELPQEGSPAEPASEEHNIVPEDVTHVESGAPAAPDSDNQVIDSSAGQESIPTTVEPLAAVVEEHAGEGTGESTGSDIKEQEVPQTVPQTDQESSGDMTHQEESVVPIEETGDKIGQDSESHQDGENIEHQPTEVPTVPQEEQSSQENVESQESPAPQEGETVHQEAVPDQVSGQEDTTAAAQQPSEAEQSSTSQPSVEPVPEQHEAGQEHQEIVTDNQESEPAHEVQPSTDEKPAHEESASETSEHQEIVTEHQEAVTESQDKISQPEETAHESSDHHETEHAVSESSPSEETVTHGPETSSESVPAEEHVSTEEGETEKHEIPVESSAAENEQDSQKVEEPTTSPASVVPSSSEHEHVETQRPEVSSELVSPAHSTEIPIEVTSSTQKPPFEEPSGLFPTWSQKPFEHHTTPEPHPAEENPYPSGFDPEYEDEEGVSYGPGTCRYGGKVYLSAQQIPRDDPCDFCFCFRSDIICLQQSCPPPIRGCYQETIKGFCCPRYECHVSMATMLNVTTTTTTTTTTLPPHFFAHAYNGAATKAGCQVKGVAYHVGERIPSTSGPCLECRCGANGQMKCDPTVCGPQEALLRQVMDAAVARRRR